MIQISLIFLQNLKLWRENSMFKLNYWNKLAILIISVVIICVVCSSKGYSTNQNQEIEMEFAQDMTEQIDAIEAYNDIIGKLKSGELNEDIYAGAYINDSKIIIMLTDLSDKSKSDFLLATDKPYAVDFNQAQYSLKYLDKKLNETVDMLEDYPITGYGFYESKNKCFVEIEQGSYTHFVSEMPYLCADDNFPILFEPGEYITECVNEDILGGTSIQTSRGFMTIGFCGRYGIRDAIITAGHGAPEGSDTQYGYVIKSQYNNNQFGDYSIIFTEPDYRITNKLNVGSILGSDSVYVRTVYSNIPEKSTVHAYGCVGKGKLGEVTATNVSRTIDSSGITIRGLTECTLSGSSTQNGDSGGPVYIPLGSYQVAACGIINGSNYSGTKMCFTPFEHIAANFSPLTSEVE